MSNQLTTQTAAPLAPIETILDGFTVDRVGKGKKAAVKTRSLLGVLNSGNMAEKNTAGAAVLLDLWQRHRYPTIKAEIDRVFPKWRNALAARNEGVEALLLERPDCGLTLVSAADVGIKKTATTAVMALCKREGEGAKGEPGKLAAQLKTVLDWECALQAQLKLVAESEAA